MYVLLAETAAAASAASAGRGRLVTMATEEAEPGLTQLRTALYDKCTAGTSWV